jgi:Flp pilus assembly pilin Flp
MDESGTTSVEYGLIAVCISVAIVTVLHGVAAKLGDTFEYVQGDLN